MDGESRTGRVLISSLGSLIDVGFTFVGDRIV